MDIDNDGDLDLFAGVYNEGIYLYVRHADGLLHLESEARGIPLIEGWDVRGISARDCDEDLDFDLYICGHHDAMSEVAQENILLHLSQCPVSQPGQWHVLRRVRGRGGQHWHGADPDALLPGTVTLSVADANGCLDTLVLEVTEPLPLDSNLEVSHPALGDSAWIELEIAGGTPP